MTWGNKLVIFCYVEGEFKGGAIEASQVAAQALEEAGNQLDFVGCYQTEVQDKPSDQIAT